MIVDSDRGHKHTLGQFCFPFKSVGPTLIYRLSKRRYLRPACPHSLLVKSVDPRSLATSESPFVCGDESMVTVFPRVGESIQRFQKLQQLVGIHLELVGWADTSIPHEVLNGLQVRL